MVVVLLQWLDFYNVSQIIYHCTIRTLDGVLVESTRSDYGGEVNYASWDLFGVFGLKG